MVLPTCSIFRHKCVNEGCCVAGHWLGGNQLCAVNRDFDVKDFITLMSDIHRLPNCLALISLFFTLSSTTMPGAALLFLATQLVLTQLK